MFNEELARRALKDLKATPQEWNQQEWRCESGMCYAGFVARAAGATWLKPKDRNSPAVITPVNEEMHVASFAARELGLSDDYDPNYETAPPIFQGGNDIGRIESLIDKYAKENDQ